MIIWYVLAIVCFGTSLIVHVSTFFTDALAMDRGTWVLHILAMVVFFPAVFILRKLSKNTNGSKFWVLPEVFLAVPRWMLFVLLIWFIYMPLNFELVMSQNQWGNPSVQNKQYVLTNHGHVIRQLNETEYHEARAVQTRGFSGHWIFFSWAAIVVLAYELRRSRQASSEGLPSST